MLNKFDQESINYAVGKYSTYDVKIFVNCKNSKLAPKKARQQGDQGEKEAATMRANKLAVSAITEDSVYKKRAKELLETDAENILNFVVAGRSEVHYTGKENIEGFASLVNLFMRSMTISCSKPSIVNVDNVEDEVDKLSMEDGQLFYYSTLEFKDRFT